MKLPKTIWASYKLTDLSHTKYTTPGNTHSLASSLLARQQSKQHHQLPAGVADATAHDATSGGGALTATTTATTTAVTPEIQSSIKEVTSAIVHFVNDHTRPSNSRSRSTSPTTRYAYDDYWWWWCLLSTYTRISTESLLAFAHRPASQHISITLSLSLSHSADDMNIIRILYYIFAPPCHTRANNNQPTHHHPPPTITH